MLEHERCFLHAQGRINVTVYEYKFDVSTLLVAFYLHFLNFFLLVPQLPVPKSEQIQIFSFCKSCGKATPFISMSEGSVKS